MADCEFLKSGTSVRHCVGTTERSCDKCGSWLKHWEKHTNAPINRCCLCGGAKEVGAHITICKAPNDKEWIIPTCKSCNSSGDTKKIKHNVYAVSAIKCS